MNTTTEQTTSGEPIEIAYRLPGAGGFRRKTFKTQAACDRFVEKLASDAEVRWAV
jgi:hypothetical protein